jgi:hypothetical protein
MRAAYNSCGSSARVYLIASRNVTNRQRIKVLDKKQRAFFPRHLFETRFTMKYVQWITIYVWVQIMKAFMYTFY